MQEPRGSLAMLHAIFPLRLAPRLREWTPDLSVRFVLRVKQLRRTVRDGVVGPGRELELPAVFGPRIASARLRDEAAEAGIGDHVRPGHRRALAVANEHVVFAPVVRKAAITVPEFQRCAAGVNPL